MSFKSVKFRNERGFTLSGRIDFPVTQKPIAYVVFAHVFTGHKNLIGAKYVSKALTHKGFAVLRFDFTGLGDSEGDFADTNFTTNVQDIRAACDFLADNYEKPSILVGQSLGGAATIFAAHEIDSIKAVATIGAPSEPEHVMHLLNCKSEDIERNGSAKVTISGRDFTIKKQFLDDLNENNMFEMVKQLRKALLILHSPQDEIVEIENAAEIYHAAFHPKSFITLDGSDHMLSDKQNARYAGEVIAAWVRRYIDIEEREELDSSFHVVARLEDDNAYTTDIKAGDHYLTADEPTSIGGNDFGPTPYELLASALAACKAMTLQMYARRKKWLLEEVRVHVSYENSYAEDCLNCSEKESRLGLFKTAVEVEGELDEKQVGRLKEIADKCPVHKTLTGNIEIRTDS